MTREASVRNLTVAAAAMTAAFLQACASTAPAPAPKTAPVAPVAAPAPQPVQPEGPKFEPTPGLSTRERALKILTLLNDGQRDQARADATQLLHDEPGNMLAQSLFDQIDKDPKLLLGEKNFAYKIQPGDSLSILAQRFLGDRFLFYALARYNSIDKPGAAEVGQTILIPGTPSKAPPRSARPVRQESDEAAVEARLKKAPPPGPAAPTPPPKPAHDPARAAALRGQALAALNGGAADRAVSLLRQAASLDPDNAAIRRDLVRAERIQATLHR